MNIKEKTTSKLGKKIYLQISITILAFFFLFKSINFQDIQNQIKDIKIIYFLFALFLFQISIIFRTIRWKFLLSYKQKYTSLKTLILLNYSGTFFDVFLPTGFGGDVIRTIELNNIYSEDTLIENTNIILLDRLSGFFALFTIAFIAIPFAYNFIPFELTLLLIGISIFGFILGLSLVTNIGLKQIILILEKISFLSKITNLLKKIVMISKKGLLKAWGISIIFHITLIFMHYFVNLSLNGEVNLLAFFIFTPIVSISLIIPSIQGLGIRENIYEFLLNQIDAPQGLGASIGIVIYLIKLLTGIFGGVIYLLYSVLAKKQKK